MKHYLAMHFLPYHAQVVGSNNAKRAWRADKAEHAELPTHKPNAMNARTDNERLGSRCVKGSWLFLHV